MAAVAALREPLKHRLVVWTSVIERQERTKPHTLLCPLPFRREARGELLGSCARLSASQSAHRKHERSEGTAPSQAGVDVVLVLLLLLVLG
jgi:hypothetical protein